MLNSIIDDKVVDPLQQDVDPELLVSSNGKGPTARRQAPTQKAPQAKVNVQNIIFVHVLGVSMLSPCVHTLCAETICVSLHA
jgi:hypothetical protein